MTIWRMSAACCIIKATRAQARARALHLHARTRMLSLTHTHRHTHTHTHTAFPRQKCFRERVSVLRYTYIGPLVYFTYVGTDALCDKHHCRMVGTSLYSGDAGSIFFFQAGVQVEVSEFAQSHCYLFAYSLRFFIQSSNCYILLKIQVLWDVTPCRLLSNFRRFEGAKIFSGTLPLTDTSTGPYGLTPLLA